MSKEEWDMLESLLGKMCLEFPGGRQYSISITPEVIQDLYSVGVYDRLTGKFIDSSVGATLQLAVELLIKKLQP